MRDHPMYPKRSPFYDACSIKFGDFIGLLFALFFLFAGLSALSWNSALNAPLNSPWLDSGHLLEKRGVSLGVGVTSRHGPPRGPVEGLGVALPATYVWSEYDQVYPDDYYNQRMLL